jgi:hypothetical protein
VSKSKLGVVRAITDLPPDCYRLSTDGRKWKCLCEARQKLANWLALKGNPDGTQIFPGIQKMMKPMGWSHGKVCYVLDDLQTIGCVVSERKRTKERGTRLRRFDPSPLLAACAAIERGGSFKHADARVQDSPQESNLQTATIQHSEDQESKIDRPRVQDTEPKSKIEDLQSNPGLDTTVLSDRPILTDHPTATEKSDGLVGWMQSHYGQEKGILSVSDKEKTQLKALSETYSVETIRKVWAYWIENRPRGLDGLVHIVNAFVNEFGSGVEALGNLKPEYSNEEIRDAIDRNVRERHAEITRELADIAREKELAAVGEPF